MELLARPLSDFPGVETRSRRRSPFQLPGGRGRVPLGRTLRELERELQHLGVRRAVLEMDVRERDLRLDGGLRADAAPMSPRVVLSFEHPQQGPTRIPADRYDHFADNVRAIRLALEALRAVDRYGITRKAEQYRGWRALPAESSATLNAEAAARIVVSYDPATSGLDSAGAVVAAGRMLKSADATRTAIRNAARATHPDAEGGDTERFQALQSARTVLAAHFGLSTL